MDNMQDNTQEILNQLVAEAVDYIHGKARDQVVHQLGNAKDTSQTMAGIAYKASEGILKKHKKRGFDVDMALAMGLATEIIDMELEMLERISPDVANSNQQQLREDTLLRTMLIHAEKVQEENPDAKEDAMVMMRSFIEDGSTDQAFEYVNKRAAREGINIDDMKRAGNEMAMSTVGGGKRPVAAGVEQAMQGGPPEDAPLMGGPANG